MTIKEEMLSVLFDEKTLKKVKSQFKSGNEKSPVDNPDMTFRLFKTEFGTINLELLCSDKTGMYFKPIGFYSFIKRGFLNPDKFTITVLNEFKEEYKSLNLKTPNKFEVEFMDLKESAVIAAFSRETVEKVEEMYQLKAKGLPQSIIDQIGPYPHLHAMQFDKSLNSNGLDIDLLFSMDSVPQCFLDDKYNVQGAFGVYLRDNNGYDLRPTVEHKNNFDKFYKMGLLSVFNGF
ncbi:hypothetical protein MKO06_03830 [Gramella sp. GC03-9]|uniref:Uncharacterized protein n=1 Tax=Christiangramia oceanisediminis TaxID=2920386 RepID=A0A9X2I0I1_9FLAO|nr:hypothetical protein [Gramella oceanisediminis]MCP9199024.1 hypothetical protein [Gramella oceanisediminis]